MELNKTQTRKNNKTPIYCTGAHPMSVGSLITSMLELCLCACVFTCVSLCLSFYVCVCVCVCCVVSKVKNTNASVIAQIKLGYYTRNRIRNRKLNT